ncbi:hypothetical protein C0V73_22690 [Rhizobium sp. TH135]|uniref:hypothetical protein n=1 Tax=Rhizobium sp. TH135 TaxID=2067451 RepID=UPI000C7B7AA7|nr:hypothetical protein [Rhizobium sp. TH135]PLK68682.1 hypothetical protein C0V73_22690 [Rhizobium sp. TH135]
MIDFDEDQKLARKLQQIHNEMDRLEALDEVLMKKAYRDPDAAQDLMMAYRDENGDDGLFAALRANPDFFGAYPEEKARFDDAYMARKELPVVYAQYRRLRDEADVIQAQRNRFERERDEPRR